MCRDGTVKLAEVLRGSGKISTAREILLKWLEDHPDQPTPQLITWLLDRGGEIDSPETVIGWTTRGIRDLAMEQPTASLNNFYMKRGLAYDRQAFLAETKIEIKKNIESALADFKTARSVGLRGVRLASLNNRTTALLRLAEDNGISLQSVDENDGEAPRSAAQVATEILQHFSEHGATDASFVYAEQRIEGLATLDQAKALEMLERASTSSKLPQSLRDTIKAYLNTR